MWAGAIVGAIAGTWFIPWAAVGGAGLMVLILGGWISYLLLKDSSDGRIGCFGIGATLFGLAACASIAEEDYGQSIASNMLGGAILGAFITFWTAKKIMFKKTAESKALDSPRIVALLNEGWKPGVKP
jgi:hypothetical protein